MAYVNWAVSQSKSICFGIDHFFVSDSFGVIYIRCVFCSLAIQTKFLEDNVVGEEQVGTLLLRFYIA